MGFAALSPASRLFRFMGPHPRLTEEDLARFAHPHDRDHEAIGALLQTGGDERPLGIARYIRTDPDRAEMAMTVIDCHQGKGLGRILLGGLRDHARQNGVAALTALVHPQNRAMARLLDRAGARVVARADGVVEYLLPVAGD